MEGNEKIISIFHPLRSIVNLQNPEKQHISLLSKRLGVSDKMELEIVSRYGVFREIKESVELADERYCVQLNGANEFLLFGIRRTGQVSSVVWMLPTVNFIGELKKRMTKTSAVLTLNRQVIKILNIWNADHAVLYNYVWDQNKRVIKWLDALGFEFEEKGGPHYREGCIFFYRTNETLLRKIEALEEGKHIH